MVQLTVRTDQYCTSYCTLLVCPPLTNNPYSMCATVINRLHRCAAEAAITGEVGYEFDPYKLDHKCRNGMVLVFASRTMHSGMLLAPTPDDRCVGGFIPHLMIDVLGDSSHT
jgi:hypothetical protein